MQSGLRKKSISTFAARGQAMTSFLVVGVVAILGIVFFFAVIEAVVERHFHKVTQRVAQPFP